MPAGNGKEGSDSSARSNNFKLSPAKPSYPVRLMQLLPPIALGDGFPRSGQGLLFSVAGGEFDQPIGRRVREESLDGAIEIADYKQSDHQKGNAKDLLASASNRAKSVS